MMAVVGVGRMFGSLITEAVVELEIEIDKFMAVVVVDTNYFVQEVDCCYY